MDQPDPRPETHTPGPWRAVMYVPADEATWPADDGTGVHVGRSATDPEPRLVVLSPANQRHQLMGDADGGLVAEVIVWHGGEAPALEQAKANARLLAAAPRLLAIADAVVRAVNQRHATCPLCHYPTSEHAMGCPVYQAAAAGAQARGERP